MVFLKAATILAAGVLTLVTVKRMMAEAEAAKIRVKAQNQSARAQRLCRDPETGIYYVDHRDA